MKDHGFRGFKQLDLLSKAWKENPLQLIETI
jgi:hypothetical protein